MHHYELVVVLSPMLNQEQVADTWGRIKDFIGNRNGDITYEERWGTRRLAYPIRKGSHQFLEGSYHLTRFNAEKSFNNELNTFLKLDEQVLRSLVVATQAPGVEPDTPIQVREAAAQAAAARAAAVAAAEAAAAAEESAVSAAEAIGGGPAAQDAVAEEAEEDAEPAVQEAVAEEAEEDAGPAAATEDETSGAADTDEQPVLEQQEADADAAAEESEDGVPK